MRQRCRFGLGLGGKHRLGQPVRIFHPGLAAPALQRHVICPGWMAWFRASLSHGVIGLARGGRNVSRSPGKASSRSCWVSRGNRFADSGRRTDRRRGMDGRSGRLSRHGRGAGRCFTRLPDVADMDIDTGIGSGGLGGPCFSLWRGQRTCHGGVHGLRRPGQGLGTRKPQRPQAQCSPCAAPTCGQRGIVFHGCIVRHRDRIFRHFVGSRGQRITQASSWRPSAAR